MLMVMLTPLLLFLCLDFGSLLLCARGDFNHQTDVILSEEQIFGGRLILKFNFEISAICGYETESVCGIMYCFLF